MTNKSILSKLFIVLLLIIILTIGFQRKDELYYLLKNTKLKWFTAGLIFYFCNYITRAHRLRVLAGKNHFSFIVGLKLSSLHGFYSYFLPFRSGDFSLPLLLNRYSTLPLVSGGSILLRARLLDMLSLGVLLSCAVLTSYKALETKVTIFFILSSLVLLGAPFLIKLLIAKGRGMRPQWIKTFSNDIFRQPMTLNEMTISLLIWFWTGCTLFSATKALSIPIQFMDIWFLVAIQLPLQLFPIQGIANTGNHEVGWVTGFTLLGISPEEGIDFAIASHVIITTYVLMLGFIGFFLADKKLIP